jgi:hypothetical protein
MTRLAPVLPYLKRAHQLGWATLLACPNTNFVVKANKRERKGGDAGQHGNMLAGSESPSAHVASLWEHVVNQHQHRVLIAAHSSGGPAIVELACKYKRDFVKRVCGVVLLDSVHRNIPTNDVSVLDLFRKCACNFVTSNTPLGCEVRIP